MAKEKVPFSLIFTTYYVSIFINKCAIELVARIFDVFLFEGENVITSIVVKLYKHNKSRIMKLDDCTMNDFLSNHLLDNYLAEKSIESLFE